MAGTTTNFAIPYPSSTDYVTDGATAMRDIADKVDAVLFTGSSSGNLIINGAMQVSQRSAVGTAVTGITTSNYYTADRWRTHISALGTWTQTTIADAPTGSGFINSLKLACTTADASPATTDFVLVQQKIEGQNLQAIRKGTASAQTLTLSFWVKAFQTGTFICELVAGSRAVSKSYTVAVSNTWEYKSVVFPADVSTVIANDNAEGLSLNWWLGAGTDYTSGTLQTTWGTITSANRAVGVTNLASSTSNTWFMTGAQLTVGSVATPFEFKSFADNLRDCQRYYQEQGTTAGAGSYGYFATGWNNTGFEAAYGFLLRTPMRSAPSVTTSAANTFYIDRAPGGGVATTLTIQALRSDSVRVNLQNAGTATIGMAAMLLQNNASTAFFAFSAEL